MKPHTCKASHTCTCYQLATEPDDYCPIHGGCTKFPEHCEVCGRFVMNDWTRLQEFLNVKDWHPSLKGL